ncbi:MAG: hypothetical protein SWH61_02295 [Thermodesulfobacteriota bacterium]|nr:hypothetical protein [Thermodesulfobacteriota bacterium]
MFQNRSWILGFKRRPSPPRYFIWGKHRSFADYIAVTGTNRVMHKLSAWAQREKTLTIVNRCVDEARQRHWHYWMITDNRLHLGLMSISRDRGGRPSLLIISGCGPEMAVGHEWERINTAGTASRHAMMKMAAGEIVDMDDLHRQLSGLPWPDPAEPAPVDPHRRNDAIRKIRDSIQTDRARCLNDKTVRFRTIDDDVAGEDDPVWPEALRHVMQIRPKSMFWRTAGDITTMVLFFREMIETDFIDLWETDSRIPATAT